MLTSLWVANSEGFIGDSAYLAAPITLPCRCCVSLDLQLWVGSLTVDLRSDCLIFYGSRTIECHDDFNLEHIIGPISRV